MNPVLIKPEAENRSQVVLLGRPDRELSRMSWRARPPHLWPTIVRALTELHAEHQLVLIEGAGSPAETNLRDSDLANMRTAARGRRRRPARRRYQSRRRLRPPLRHLGAARRRGAGPDHRVRAEQVPGDASLLAPAPARLQELTGVATLGVLPWLDHGLARRGRRRDAVGLGPWPAVAVLRYPTASNLDEFKPLEQPCVLRWATDPRDLDDADSGRPPRLQARRRRPRLAAPHRHRPSAPRSRRRGARCSGSAAGCRCSAERVEDDAGVDGTAKGWGCSRSRPGSPRQAHRADRHRFTQLAGPWAPLSGCR